MGMAASQCRLLSLTNRSHDIQCMENRLTRQKMDLTRETQKISKEYNNALNAKVLKWSTNSGITYTDITYSGLMRPSSMNSYTPYLLTDTRDRVVLDSKYAKYAKYMDANGGYDACRYALLAEATGIDAATIQDAEASELKTETLKNQYKATELAAQKALESVMTSKSAHYWATHILSDAISKIPTGSYDSTNQANLFNEVNKGTDFAQALIDTLVTIFTDDEATIKEKVDEALNNSEGSGLWNTLNQWTQTPTAGDSSCGFKYDGTNFSFTDEAELVEKILTNMGLATDDGKFYYYNFAAEGSNAGLTKSAYEALLQDAEDARNAYEAQQSYTNNILTSEQEQQIRFYDSLFMSIAEKGWVENSQVSDTDYLNQMLQNNLYTITTIDYSTALSDEGMSQNSVGKGSYKVFYDNYNNSTILHGNDYKSYVASNLDTVFSVSDTNARENALVEYEYKKSIIDAKESIIDTRLNDLKTENSAVQQMIQSIENVRNDNQGRTFNWCTNA